MKNKQRHFFWITYLVSGIFLYPIIVALVERLNLNNPVIISVLSDFIVVSIFLLHRKDYFKEELLKFINYFKVNYKECLKLGFLIIAVNFSTSVICSFIIMFVLKEDPAVVNQEILLEMTSMSPILMGISVVLLAPILEEIVFRLSLFGIFKNRNNKFLAYFFGAFVFTIMHTILNVGQSSLLASILLSLPYLAISVILCYTYDKTDMIFYTIYLHLFNNLFGFITSFLG